MLVKMVLLAVIVVDANILKTIKTYPEVILHAADGSICYEECMACGPSAGHCCDSLYCDRKARVCVYKDAKIYPEGILHAADGSICYGQCKACDPSDSPCCLRLNCDRKARVCVSKRKKIGSGKDGEVEQSCNRKGDGPCDDGFFCCEKQKRCKKCTEKDIWRCYARGECCPTKRSCTRTQHCICTCEDGLLVTAKPVLDTVAAPNEDTGNTRNCWGQRDITTCEKGEYCAQSINDDGTKEWMCSEVGDRHCTKYESSKKCTCVCQ